MRHQESLQKIQNLLIKQEVLLFKKCAQSKKKMNEEQRTLDFLKKCLDEYREKLKTQSQGSISSYQYQRFCRFMTQLEVAIDQQILTIQKVMDAHQRLISEYEVITSKISKIQELIEKEKKSIEYLHTRKENQSATDLFNQLNHKKSR